MSNKYTLTLSQLEEMDPCDFEMRKAKLFDNGLIKSLTVAEAFERGATVGNILWVAGQLGEKKKIVAFAEACEQRIKKYAPSSWSAQQCAKYVSCARDSVFSDVAAEYATSASSYAIRCATYSDEPAERQKQKNHLIKLFSS